MHAEIFNANTGEPLLQVDVAWPNGIQEGLSEPVALLIAADAARGKQLNELGYRYFERPEDLERYIADRTR